MFDAIAATDASAIADSATASIVCAVEMDIMLGRLLPRERLLGEALAARFAVNRNQVRRAFAVLEQRGLVTVHLNRGAQVRDFSAATIAELIETREVLQQHALSRLALPAEAALLPRMEALCAAHIAAIERRDLPAVLAANAAFHDTLFRAAGNAVAANAIARLSDLLTVVRAYRLADPAELQRGVRGHQAMLTALRASDRPGLMAAVQAHVSSAGKIAARREEWTWNGEVVSFATAS